MNKGDKINFLTMVSEKEREGRRSYALFQCDCGRIKRIRIDQITTGNTKSCGCKQKELHKDNKPRLTHGGYHTRLYRIYGRMIQRCCNPNYSETQYYLGRGITICKEWMDSFESFRDWANANGYADNLSIDRIDVNKGYSPDNCRWATAKEQSRNKRNNIVITHNGKSKTLVEWCEDYKLPYGTIEMRIRRGWNKERAITEPIKKLEG